MKALIGASSAMPSERCNVDGAERDQFFGLGVAPLLDQDAGKTDDELRCAMDDICRQS